MDKVFLLTLLFVFLTALIGTYVKRRSRDLCLKDFTGFHVTVAMKTGARLWGRLLVFPNAAELVYATPHKDERGHVETSTILFKDRIEKIQAVYRFHDELTPKQQERRLTEIRRTHHPNFFRRSRRGLRNFINIFRDAFGQSIGLAVSQMKKVGTTSAVLQTQDTRLSQMGQEMLGAVPNAYEPVLERYIGRRVVVEELKGDAWVEHPGILKEYTAAWIEVLGCRVIEPHEFDLSEPAQLQVNRDLDFVIGTHPPEDGAGSPRLALRVENKGTNPVRLLRLHGEGYDREISVRIEPAGTHEILVDDLPGTLFDAGGTVDEARTAELRSGEEDHVVATPHLPAVHVVIEALREGDLCLPRTAAVVRHGGELLDSWAKRLRDLGSF